MSFVGKLLAAAYLALITSTTSPAAQLTFSEVNASIPGCVGLAFHEPSQSLVVSYNYGTGVFSPDFGRIRSDALVEPFGVFQGLSTPAQSLRAGGPEIKLASIRSKTAGGVAGGFALGDSFCGYGEPGKILKITSNGSIAWTGSAGAPQPSAFATLSDANVSATQTGEVIGITHDREGTIGGTLVAATLAGDVWKVTSSGLATRVAQFNLQQGEWIEAVAVIPNNPSLYFNLAGKILVGINTETAPQNGGSLWWIDPNSFEAIDPYAATPPNLVYRGDLPAEDIDIVNPGEQLFAACYSSGNLCVIPTAPDQLSAYQNKILVTTDNGVMYALTYNGSWQLGTPLTPGTGIGSVEATVFVPASVTIAPKVWAETVVPQTYSGSANPAVIRLSRSGGGEEQRVLVNVSPNPQGNLDYSVIPPLNVAGASRFFTIPAGQTYVDLRFWANRNPAASPYPITLTILPYTTVALAGYDVGTPSSATVNIVPPPQSVVVSLDGGGALAESDSLPSSLVVTRSPSSANPLTVTLAYGGTASFGADFIIEGANPDGTVTIPAGQASVTLQLSAVPDNRFEGDETLFVSAMTPVGNAYTSNGSIGSFTVIDDDTNQIPLPGWKLTDLGTLNGSAGAYGYGINTIPDGAGGWRGQAVGQVFNLNRSTNTMAVGGFKWNNGSSSYLLPPSSYTSYPESAAWAINDDQVAVGFAGDFYYVYRRRACLWKGSQNQCTLLPDLHTPNSLVNMATDINERDDVLGTPEVIVGNQLNSVGRTHAVAWVSDVNGSYTTAPIDLNSLGGSLRDSYANAINGLGVTVGRSQLSSGTHFHAFRSRANSGVPIPLLLQDDQGTATGVATDKSEALDINHLGELVGASDVVPPGSTKRYSAAYKTPGSGLHQGWIDLGVLGQGANAGDSSVAKSINPNGLIVGQSRIKVNGSFVTRAFVLSNQGNVGTQPLLNLNEYSWVLSSGQWYRADNNGWALLSAERVNDAGWVVAYGVKSGTTRAVLLSPR